MVVPLAGFQFAGILRPEQRPISVEYKEMRVAGNLWVFREKIFILVSLAEIDLYVDEVLREGNPLRLCFVSQNLSR